MPASELHARIVHEADPNMPGWYVWEIAPPERFNSVLGKFRVRPDGPGRGVCRMFPEAIHCNLADVVHGGALMTFIDIALFAGGRLAGANVSSAVTLDCSTQFLSPGRMGVPLDAEVELLKETKRLAFLRGRVVQDGEVVAAFTGTLRKPG